MSAKNRFFKLSNELGSYYFSLNFIQKKKYLLTAHVELIKLFFKLSKIYL